MPDAPVGPCLSDDEDVTFAAGMLSPTREAEIDEHLASCDKCLARVEEVFDGASDWLRPSAEPRLAALRHDMRAAWTSALPGTARRQALVSWVKRIATELAQPPLVPAFRVLGGPFGPPHTWSTDRLVGVLRDDHGTLVLSIQSREAAWVGRLAWFAIEEETSRTTIATGWLVLHDEGGGAAGAARLTSTFARPTGASLRVEICELTDGQPPDVDELGQAYAAAGTEADRTAWRHWVDVETSAGHLSAADRTALLGRR